MKSTITMNSEVMKMYRDINDSFRVLRRKKIDGVLFFEITFFQLYTPFVLLSLLRLLVLQMPKVLPNR